MKIAGSGSISQRHGSADPDPHQNVMYSQHWKKDAKLQEKASSFISVDIICMCVNSSVSCSGNQSPQRIRLRDV